MALSFSFLVGCSGGTTTEKPVAGPNGMPIIPGQESPNTAEGNTFPNTSYLAWEKFPVGTKVVQETTTENENNPEKTVTTIAYELKSKSDTELIIESTAKTKHFTGRIEENPPLAMKHPRFFRTPAKTEDTKKPTEKEKGKLEKVTVRAGVFEAEVTTGKDFTEGGDLASKMWVSDQVPGGLVKSVMRVEAKKATITVETIEIVKPK